MAPRGTRKGSQVYYALGFARCATASAVTSTVNRCFSVGTNVPDLWLGEADRRHGIGNGQSRNHHGPASSELYPVSNQEPPVRVDGGELDIQKKSLFNSRGRTGDISFEKRLLMVEQS